MGKTIKLQNDTYIANDLYDGNEHIIGEWFGKPLYRKIIIFPNGTGVTSLKSYLLSNYGITNIDEIYISKPSYYTLGQAHYPFQYNDGSAFECNVSPTQLNLTITYSPIANSKILITLEYTKTTD